MLFQKKTPTHAEVEAELDEPMTGLAYLCIGPTLWPELFRRWALTAHPDEQPTIRMIGEFGEYVSERLGLEA